MKEQLLMIPGTLCDDLLFTHQVHSLSDIAQCKIVSSNTSNKLSDVASRILEHADDEFSIMGLSYGGIIALELWRQASKKIKKLILLNCNYKAPSETTRSTMKHFIEMAQQGQFEEITTEILTDTMLHPKHAKKKNLRDVVLQMAQNVGKEGFYNQVEAQLGRPDSTHDLPNITCPTLIITGRQDKVCPLELHEEMANLIPGASLKIIENCGHLSTLEQPDEVNSSIKNWWKKYA